MIDREYILKLFGQYGDELQELSRELRKKYFSLLSRGFRATFSDFEGEVLYLLIRDRKPQVVFEISPDCGYSTNYMHAAVIRNGSGKLFSFEIEAVKNGRPTEEVIRDSLINKDFSNHKIVFGDAMKTVADYPDPDLTLIDSCHDDYFAEWYLDHLLPRNRDLVLLQDIAYFDRREYSTEADVVLDRLDRERRSYISLGVLERETEFVDATRALHRRRFFQSNSILISNGEKIAHIPADLRDPIANNQFALFDADAQQRVEDHLGTNRQRPNLHRTYMRLCAGTDAKPEKAYYRSLAMGSAVADSAFSKKAATEIILLLLKERSLLMAMKVAILEPSAAIAALRLLAKRLLRGRAAP